MKKSKKQPCLFDQVLTIRTQIETAAKLTAALAESLAEPPLDWTLENLYDAEYLAARLLSTIFDPAFAKAIRNLADNSIIDPEAAGIDTEKAEVQE